MHLRLSIKMKQRPVITTITGDLVRARVTIIDTEERVHRTIEKSFMSTCHVIRHQEIIDPIDTIALIIDTKVIQVATILLGGRHQAIILDRVEDRPHLCLTMKWIEEDGIKKVKKNSL
jgi:hypothetical protein